MGSKLNLHMPTPDEDAAIQRGIDADLDTYVPTDEEFAKMKSRGGRPKLAHPKVAVTIRYDAEIVERFRSGGDGWQTRMNDALREWLRHTRVSRISIYLPEHDQVIPGPVNSMTGSWRAYRGFT